MSDERLERIEAKLDKVNERLSSMDATLAGQHVSLKDHIRRTTLLEAMVEVLRRHDAMWAGALKLVGIGAMLAGIIEGTVALLAYLRHVG